MLGLCLGQFFGDSSQRYTIDLFFQFRSYSGRPAIFIHESNCYAGPIKAASDMINGVTGRYDLRKYIQSR